MKSLGAGESNGGISILHALGTGKGCGPWRTARQLLSCGRRQLTMFANYCAAGMHGHVWARSDCLGCSGPPTMRSVIPNSTDAMRATKAAPGDRFYV